MKIREMLPQIAELYDMQIAGEIDEQTFIDTLEAMGVNDKIDNLCGMFQQYKADEKMLDEENKPFTSHTTNPVKFAIVGYACELKKNRGKLADVAPTMLDILGIEKPAQMTGKSLIDSKNL